MAALEDEMKRVKQDVDGVILSSLLPASSPIREVDLLYKMMRDYPSRPAKGLRPFLCVTTCRAAGGRREEALLTAACVELFQHWILIHDDIEDGSELRRGQPTLHLKQSPALALNAGDALHARMWGALLRNESVLGPERTLGVLAEFSRMVDATTEGQQMELAWVGNRRWDLREHDYYEMCSRKTSWYTVAGPCRLGAIVAGAAQSVLDGLQDFGIKLGVAFQIQDDVLNLAGDESKYGKAKSDDILEGKRTLMLLHLLGEVGADEKARIVSIMNKERRAKTQDDVSYVLDLMREHDVLKYGQQRARELMQGALSDLKRINLRGEADAVSLLEEFSRFAVERQW